MSKEPIAAPRIPDDMRGLGLDDEWPEMWASFSATQREEQIREQRLQMNRLRRSRRLLREAEFANATVQEIRVRRNVYRSKRFAVFEPARDISREFLAVNEATHHRLLRWLRREIIALFGCRIEQFQPGFKIISSHYLNRPITR